VGHCAGLVPAYAEGGDHLSTIIPEDKHRDVLGICVDVPEESPSFPMDLQKVGISGKTVWVSLTENKGGRIPFTAAVYVSLPGSRRGIHMSRIEQVITILHEKEFAGLPEYGKEFASRVLEAQNTQHVSLELTGQLPFKQQAPVSRLTSIDTIDVTLKVELAETRTGIEEKVSIGVSAYHLTACPCTLSYNQVLFDRFDDPWPQATHSQRSITEISVRPPESDQLPTYVELVTLLSGVLHMSQDLLKRPDETELVLKAHRSPQFAEDTAREVAQAAGNTFRKKLPPETGIKVRTLSLESIHIHDVECCLHTTLGEILAIQASKEQEQNR
jgi:GTP cyclohydrolase FolE2